MTVDTNALRFNQATLTLLIIMAFVVGGTVGLIIVAATAASLLVAAAFPKAGPFGLVYRNLVLRFGWMSPQPEPDDPAPHRFAQLLGGAVLAIATVALVTGLAFVGWVLGWLVIALALTNLFLGFCLGCFLFLQLARAGIISRSVEAS